MELYRPELEVIQNQEQQNNVELLNYNKYVTEKRINNPSLTGEQIQTMFFKELYKKEQYKDKYFDIMYTKLSKSNRF